MFAGARTVLLSQSPMAGWDFALDFRNGLYVPQRGAIITDPTRMPGYSYTRSGAKSELNASGSPVPFAANVPGIVPGVGYWSRAAMTNFLKWDRDLSQSTWTKRGTAAVATDTEPGADGTGLAYRVSGLGANPTNDLFQSVSGGLGASIRVEPSFSIKKVSSPGTLRLRDAQTGGSGGSWAIDLTLVGSGWQRITRSHPAVTITNEFVSTAGGAGGVVFDTASGTLSFYLDFASMVAGTQPGPIIVTAGSTAAVGADVLKLSSMPVGDEDFTMLATGTLLDVTSDARLISLDDASTNNRVLLRAMTGIPSILMTSGGVAQSVSGLATPMSAGSRVSMLVRRRSGKMIFGARAGSTVTFSAESGVTTWPTGLSQVEIGNFTFINQWGGPIEFFGIRRGTFSDADLSAMLVAA